jgi:hypothetical protein
MPLHSPKMASSEEALQLAARRCHRATALLFRSSRATRQ